MARHRQPSRLSAGQETTTKDNDMAIELDSPQTSNRPPVIGARGLGIEGVGDEVAHGGVAAFVGEAFQRRGARLANRFRSRARRADTPRRSTANPPAPTWVKRPSSRRWVTDGLVRAPRVKPRALRRKTKYPGIIAKVHQGQPHRERQPHDPGVNLLLIVAGAALGCKPVTGGCASDAGCKGTRICERGACMEPTAPRVLLLCLTATCC
mgnify:CR=1 FL=1